MPVHALIITDPEKQHAYRRQQHLKRFERERPHATPARREQLVDAHIAAGRLPKPERDSLHTVADDVCPEGKPNCRNCGDPAFAASCRKVGHCPDCGIKHGIAPDSHLAAVGLSLHPLDELPAPGQVWDAKRRTFAAAEKKKLVLSDRQPDVMQRGRRG